jgi:magnesium transporter
MLINCVAYRDGQKVADLRKEDIHSYVSRPEYLVWVALVDPPSQELTDFAHEFGLHELAVEDARMGHERPKLEEYGDSLFAVVHTVEQDGDDVAVGEVDIFAGKNYVLTVRNRTTRGFAEVRARCEREPQLLKYGSGFVLYALIDAIVDRYFPLVDTLEIELDKIEERVFTGIEPRRSIEALYALKRKLMTLKHATGPLQETTGKLYGGRVPEICANAQEYFRDVYDNLFRINQSIDSLREMVTTAQSVNLSLITIQENETMKRLAAYAALVAVPTMIAGIYGMNFQHMPELSSPFGYPLTLGAMFIVDGYLFYRLRKAKWL